MISGENCATSPAMTTPPGRRTPNVTATATQKRPTSGLNTAGLLVLPPIVAYSAPPNPAMNADTANNPSFVLTGDTPDVAAAVSAVRTATIARPDADRLR